MLEITDELLDKHIGNILGVIDKIQEGKITVIVDNNGFGTVEKDYNAWKNRELVGVDLDWLESWSSKLYHRINERSRK